MANLLGFTPYVGQSQKLNSVLKKNGQFLITVDDGKIYVDVNDERYLVSTKNILKSQEIILEGNSWEEENNIYVQTALVEDIKKDTFFDVKPVISLDASLGVQEKQAFNLITNIIIEEDGTIKFLCYEEPPQIDFSVQIFYQT